ncbi:MAG: pyridoxamine 5'-phosphate oxidase family protein [Acidimicrobiales bacterium]
MGKSFDALTDEHIEWIGRQHLFFVASAPLDAAGHVNLSPKGYDTFRVVDESTVAYLDLTGSGVETIAHLRENGRLTVMFCAFEGRPRILRIYGTGTAVRADDEGFDALSARFGSPSGLRSIITLAVERVGDSCGFSVPFLEYAGERETLVQWSDRKDQSELGAYWNDRNAVSIDGLPGMT